MSRFNKSAARARRIKIAEAARREELAAEEKQTNLTPDASDMNEEEPNNG